MLAAGLDATDALLALLLGPEVQDGLQAVSWHLLLSATLLSKLTKADLSEVQPVFQPLMHAYPDARKCQTQLGRSAGCCVRACKEPFWRSTKLAIFIWRHGHHCHCLVDNANLRRSEVPVSDAWLSCLHPIACRCCCLQGCLQPNLLMKGQGDDCLVGK